MLSAMLMESGSISPLSPKLNITTSLVWSSLLLGSPLLAPECWNYRWAAIPTWHLLGFWGSELESSCLPVDVLFPESSLELLLHCFKT